MDHFEIGFIANSLEKKPSLSLIMGANCQHIGKEIPVEVM